MLTNTIVEICSTPLTTAPRRHAMVNSIVHIEGNTWKVDDKEYSQTTGLRMLILYKKPRPQHYTSDDYSVYKAIVAQTRVRAYPNKRAGSARPRSTWKWKHIQCRERSLK